MVKKIGRPGPAAFAPAPPPMSATSPTHDVADVTSVKTPSSSLLLWQITCPIERCTECRDLSHFSRSPLVPCQKRAVSEKPICVPIGQPALGRSPTTRTKGQQGEFLKAGNRARSPARSPRICATSRFRSPLERTFGFAAPALMEAGGIEIAPPAAFHNGTRRRSVDFRILRVFRRLCASCDLKVARQGILFL
jgi:hypothetical protein